MIRVFGSFVFLLFESNYRSSVRIASLEDLQRALGKGSQPDLGSDMIMTYNTQI